LGTANSFGKPLEDPRSLRRSVSLSRSFRRLFMDFVMIFNYEQITHITSPGNGRSSTPLPPYC
jgi:hypothetical protein